MIDYAKAHGFLIAGVTVGTWQRLDFSRDGIKVVSPCDREG